MLSSAKLRNATPAQSALIKLSTIDPLPLIAIS
jgi:hypothetical protein